MRMGKGRGFGEDVLSFGYDWVYYWFFGVEAFEAFLIPNLGIYLPWDDDILRCICFCSGSLSNISCSTSLLNFSQ